MKTQEHRLEELQHGRVEANLAASLNALFCRCPTLCGFTVRDTANLARDGFALQQVSKLFVTEVSVFPLSGLAAPRELCCEIVAALVDLMDECPGVYELLRERTFARTLH